MDRTGPRLPGRGPGTRGVPRTAHRRRGRARTAVGAAPPPRGDRGTGDRRPLRAHVPDHDLAGLAPLLPIARYPGLAWLIIAGFQLPYRRPRTMTPAWSARLDHPLDSTA